MLDSNPEQTFEQAWTDPAHTRFELPPTDVNAVLAERYRTGEPLTFTRTMMWDNEVRKAWRPDLYIPGVVREGSADAWGRATPTDGGESFYRKSQQRLWLEPDQYGLILEFTYLNHTTQTVTFLGMPEFPDRDGTQLRADSRQALFHVEHSVRGEESRPLNMWRIVHLTEQPDHRVIEIFERIATSVWLPEFIEIYIRDDLEFDLSRHEGS